ncbi:MAG: hypothetical protein JRJ79_04135 [Deltaproteobacteria bacterium]|nr:hypothetical protein [Deltaproteobacteria bacterium]MBW1795153.1 hypothetical protein [Deltaproteobacteria bacterium]
MRRILSRILMTRPMWIVACLIVVLLLMPDMARAKRTHEIFFQGTDCELHVYRICGKEPGKTLLLIGGIQGNEPGGFLSADLYADMALAKGNLIVVPRANFYSILLNRRQVNEDMNRKFGQSSEENYEAKIVVILKRLISESNCLLNLHDGSGFYSERWESPMRNPKRYGQSIIADCETYTVPETGETLRLGDMAGRAIDRINLHIKEPGHRFRFNNHRTRDPDTIHPEQRKSATYYALFQCGIPAFGIETSKSLPLETKVYHHNLAINAFMELLDIVPETPNIYLDPPVMRYIVMAVNNNIPFAITNGYTLRIRQGDVVSISHIEANYKRGLSADIMDHGTFNDMRKPIRIMRPTQVVVRKDHHPCGMINIVLDAGQTRAHTVSALPEVLFFETRINGKEHLFMNQACVKLVRGDRLEIVDVTTNLAGPSEIVVNFKGYVGDRKNNTGEDRGYVIHTGRDLWKRYSLAGQGKKYQVVVTRDNTVMGRLFVELAEPELDYIILQVNHGVKRCLFPGDSLSIDSKDIINIVDIKTNIPTNTGVQAFLKGAGTKIRLFSDGAAFPLGIGSDRTGYNKDKEYSIVVQREYTTLGLILVNFNKGAHHGG